MQHCETLLPIAVRKASPQDANAWGLTAETIRKLQIYYSRAIRGGKTAEETRRNILASIRGRYSTDDLP